MEISKKIAWAKGLICNNWKGDKEYKVRAKKFTYSSNGLIHTITASPDGEDRYMVRMSTDKEEGRRIGYLTGSGKKWVGEMAGEHGFNAVSAKIACLLMADHAVSKKPKTEILAVKPAGKKHQVVTVKGNASPTYRKKPCKNCPWRVDAVGQFPAEAFRHSANTSFDMSEHTFGCHESGTGKPATCAGFLLKGADNNMAVRIKRIKGTYKDDVTDGGHALHENYRAMAIANGVPADDPALKMCRDR